MSTPAANKSMDLESTISGMQSYISNIEQSLAAISSQSTTLLAAGPKIEDVEKQIEPFKKEVESDDARLGEDISALKTTVREEVKTQVFDALRDRIASQVRLEIASQVKAQFDVQIRTHIPISLAEQVEQNKAQIQKVKYSRINSEARRENSTIQDTELDEPFEVVLMDNGERSDVWPADLRSLFAYDEDSLKRLLTDYNLPEDQSMEVNTNRFLSHIGITSWRLLRSPVAQA